RDASTEQQLFEALPDLSREAMARGVAVAALTAGGERIEMPLTRDQLIQAAQPLWREIARLLHELRPAGGPPAAPPPRRAGGARGVAVAALTAGGERIEMPLTRDQLIQAAQPLWREIARLLHELRPAGSALTLLVPRLVSALPGFREMMTQFTGCELVSLPAGFAAAATSLLDLPPRDAADPVRLLRRLPSESQPTLAA